MTVTENEFKTFVAKYPNLTTHGIGVVDRTYSVGAEHANLRSYYYAFLVSCHMLQKCYEIRSRFKNDRNAHSHELKHRAEDYAKEGGQNVYVPEGALVAAALYLQLPYKKSKKTPSVTLKVKEIS